MRPALLGWMQFSLGLLLTCSANSAVGQQQADVAVEADAIQAVEIVDLQANANDPRVELILRHVNRECGLARRACELTPEQLTQLKALDATWIATQLRQPLKPGGNVFGDIARFLGGRAAPVHRNDESAQVEQVQRLADERLLEILDAQQAATYLAEKAARDKFRREALARVLVHAYDKHVFVDTQQRTALAAVIEEAIKSKNLFWQFYFQNESYLPIVPNHLLSKVLTPQQLAVVQGLHAYDYSLDQMQMRGMQPEGVAIFSDE